jgi:quercetin dioxygenase-like cupin family protein
MKITNLKNAAKVPFNIEGHKMYTGESVEIIHLNMKPGEVLEMHSNPVDVVFYLIDGKGTFITEAAETIIEKDSCFRINAGLLRGWKNNSNIDLKILVFKIL